LSWIARFPSKIEIADAIDPVNKRISYWEMDKSIFTEKKKLPGNKDLVDSLGDSCFLWQLIREYVHLKYPNALDEWNYPGEKYGWSFRIKDKKRAILYLLPRDKYFKVAFVFGQKATDMILKSSVSDSIKTELQNARVYAEGRGIRIEIRDDTLMENIRELIDIKLLF
jgi:hypothetical protein